MPYQQITPGRMQLAARTAHKRAALEAASRERTFFVPAERVEPLDWLDAKVHESASLGSPRELKAVLGIDGSRAVVEARAGMPSARYGFVQVSAVLLELEKYIEQAVSRFVDPVKLQLARRDSLVSLDLPTSGAYMREGLNIRDSWRLAVHELFRERGVSMGREIVSLQEQLFGLHGTPLVSASSVEVVRCPNETCSAGPLTVGNSPTRCGDCGIEIYPTDSLRIFESVTDQGTNEEALGRLMQVVELLVLTAFLGMLYRNARSALQDTAFIADGPLAVFGESAKLKGRALRYVQEMDLPNGAPYLMGIEKSGQFVDFAEAVARHADLKPRTLITVDDDVISRVRNSTRVADYGQETYWGRKFFYYTRDKTILVVSVPPKSGEAYGIGVGQPDPAAYPSLPTLLNVIDKTGSRMYRNAIVPAVLAHEVAAYPIGVGTDVLKLVARTVLGMENGSESSHAEG